MVILGDGHVQRNGEHLDENEKGSHEHTHCSPALGGGVCPIGIERLFFLTLKYSQAVRNRSQIEFRYFLCS